MNTGDWFNHTEGIFWWNVFDTNAPSSIIKQWFDLKFVTCRLLNWGKRLFAWTVLMNEVKTLDNVFNDPNISASVNLDMSSEPKLTIKLLLLFWILAIFVLLVLPILFVVLDVLCEFVLQCCHVAYQTINIEIKLKPNYKRKTIIV